MNRQERIARREKRSHFRGDRSGWFSFENGFTEYLDALVDLAKEEKYDFNKFLSAVRRITSLSPHDIEKLRDFYGNVLSIDRNYVFPDYKSLLPFYGARDKQVRVAQRVEDLVAVKAIQNIPKLPQAQYSTRDQLQYLVDAGVRLGLYDACDVVKRIITSA